MSRFGYGLTELVQRLWHSNLESSQLGLNLNEINAVGDSGPRLLCVVAHPDDETFGSGSTLIKYAAEGVSVYTACATRGDVGEIADRSDATPETLSAVREKEYYGAGKVMGVKQSILYGYRDSGMAGTPDNDHPNAFIRVPMEQVVARIVDTIRQLKPHVVFTFDEGGGYGHPDHIHASEATKLAYFAAGDPNYSSSDLEPWMPSKLYYHGFPRSQMKRFFEILAENDPESDLAKLDPNEMGVPDESLTTELDISAYAATRREAIEVHQTQYSPLDRMPTLELEADFLNTDFFIRVDPPIEDGESGIIENDLFAGLAFED